MAPPIQHNNNISNEDVPVFASADDGADMASHRDSHIRDDDASHADGSDAEEEEEYKTSYARFADATGGQPLTKPRRRRRGGYGKPAISVLESLPSQPRAEETEERGEIEGDIDDLAMNIDEDLAVEEEVRSSDKSNIFMETQDDNDADDRGSGSGSDNDDGEDNRPCVQSQFDNIDAEGGDASEVESEVENEVENEEESGVEREVESEVESDEERPRGRTKRTGKRNESEADQKANESEIATESEAGGDSEDADDGGFPQSEASGFGFSLGENQALRNVDLETAEINESEGDDKSTLAEKSKRMEEEDAPQNEPNQPSGASVDVLSAPPSPSEHVESSVEPSSELSANPIETTPKAEPSNSQILQLVDTLFQAVDDKDTMTVGDINKSIASHYGWAKVDKKKRKMIKARLIDLMTGNAEPVIDEEGEDEAEDKSEARVDEKPRKKKKGKKSKKSSKKRAEYEPQSDGGQEEETFEEDYESEEAENGNDSSSDYDEPKKSSTESRKSKKKFSKLELHEREYDDAIDSDQGSIDAPKKTKKRSSRSKSNKGKGKMAQHIRDRHTKARLRQLEEARIRKEELGHLAADNDEENPPSTTATEEIEMGVENEEAGPQLSKEDQERANLIAARFDTDREELLTKRREERVSLIDRLRQKRLESLEEGMTLNEMKAAVEAKEENVEENIEMKTEGMEETSDSKTEVENVVSPRLTCTEATTMGAKVPKTEKPADGGAMVDLDDDDDNSDEHSDESDDDLEIIAPGTSIDFVPPTKNGDMVSKTLSKFNKPKNTSTIDLLFHPGNKSGIASRKTLRKKKVADPRMAIRSALRAKQIMSSNRWLAKELGYKGSMAGQNHIRACKEAENKKRKETLRLEKAERERMMKLEKEAALREEGEYYEFDGDVDEGNDDGNEEYDEEEDEMAMARKMDLLEPTDADGEKDNTDENLDERTNGSAERVEDAAQQTEAMESDEKSSNGDTNPDTTSNKPQDGNATSIMPSPGKSSTGSVVTPLHGQSDTVSISKNLEDENSGTMDGSASSNPFPTGENAVEEAVEVAVEDAVEEAVEEAESTETVVERDVLSNSNSSHNATSPTKPVSEPSKSKKPKNSAWQAMLQKEKETLARQKKLQKRGGNTLVDGEAEEEEEDEGIVGLEDFGFAVQPKKGDNDEVDADVVDQDDLDHVVDDVSDGEGDEEAGTNARKRLEHAEEKARHKDMIRRMKDGYDGRRGGIAGGAGGARGTIRFDQLVAAENREGAKRLGLLNDDELESDDEDEEGGGIKDKNKGDDEEEDEAALLDKWMKERVLNDGEEGNIEENFTDDEEAEDEVHEAEKTDDGHDDEDREQDRLAKHFAKRARRNRILGEFEGDSQFSRSRLIDEDVSTQQDLKTMKNSFFRKRSSASRVSSSNLDSKENNCPSKKPKGTSSEGSDNSLEEPTSSFLSHEGSLSVALMASRSTSGGRKRKTTFLSGGRQKSGSSFSRSQSSSSSSSKTVSLNHVIFTSGDSQSAMSQLPDNSTSFLMGSAKSRRGHSKSNTSKKATRGGSSLWSKVCSKNFRAN